MGIYDRDYYRAPPRAGFAHFSAWSVTTWLIIFNVAAFFADGISQRLARPRFDPATFESTPVDSSDDRQNSSEQNQIFQLAREQVDVGPLERWGAFSTRTAIARGQVWRFITFQFLHATPMHLVFNMVGLYLFGPIIEAHFLSRRYLAFYLLCGAAGAVCCVLMNVSGIVPGSFNLVGASAGVIGLLVAAAMIAPDVSIYAFLTFSITIRTAAIVAMLFAAYSVFALGGSYGNAGGEAAHLGGGIVGFLLMKNQHWLNPFAQRHSARLRRVRPRQRTPFRKGWAKDWTKDFDR